MRGLREALNLASVHSPHRMVVMLRAAIIPAETMHGCNKPMHLQAKGGMPRALGLLCMLTYTPSTRYLVESSPMTEHLPALTHQATPSPSRVVYRNRPTDVIQKGGIGKNSIQKCMGEVTCPVHSRLCALLLRIRTDPLLHAPSQLPPLAQVAERVRESRVVRVFYY